MKWSWPRPACSRPAAAAASRGWALSAAAAPQRRRFIGRGGRRRLAAPARWSPLAALRSSAPCAAPLWPPPSSLDGKPTPRQLWRLLLIQREGGLASTGPSCRPLRRARRAASRKCAHGCHSQAECAACAPARVLRLREFSASYGVASPPAPPPPPTPPIAAKRLSVLESNGHGGRPPPRALSPRLGDGARCTRCFRRRPRPPPLLRCPRRAMPAHGMRRRLRWARPRAANVGISRAPPSAGASADLSAPPARSAVALHSRARASPSTARWRRATPSPSWPPGVPAGVGDSPPSTPGLGWVATWR
jgi:hypothetical protein